MTSLMNNCCGTPPPPAPGCGCQPDPCKGLYSSQMTYDGPNLPTMCVRHGDPLNFLFQQMDKAFSNGFAQNSPIRRDEFVGPQSLVLTYQPQEIIAVIVCGGVLTEKSLYKLSGKTVVINPSICMEDTTPISVIYTSKYQPSFNTVCNV